MPDVPYIQGVTLLVSAILLILYSGPIICVRHFGNENFFLSFLTFAFVQFCLGVILPLILMVYLDSRERKEFLLQRFGLKAGRSMPRAGSSGMGSQGVRSQGTSKNKFI
eukprot:TRINITY_DN14604_c0_g2_i1.p4 TRINITY_DN14604_c0_g2~~TRINITY_DN14604_c0_g2_i1.p4  ORF type:complete len:127 (-),score=4.33 TRINITY_DN14604_c0_g2_i1:920-1246(-)